MNNTASVTESKMKAVTYKKYGGPEVLHIQEIKKPVPRKKEILVKVETATVSAGVTWLRQGKYPGSWLFTGLLRLMYGITKPRYPVLGVEFAGTVVQVGAEVVSFKPGDKVYGTTTGLKQGSYAEYTCIPEKRRQGVTAIKPPQLSMEQAAALPVGGMTALDLLTKAKIATGQKILIYGASGSVGSSAVQLAKYYCAKVTAVCSSANFEWVRSLGADKLIDYKREDIAQLNDRFDIVFDAVGKLPDAVGWHLLNKEGRYCTVRGITDEKLAYLKTLHQLVEQGEFQPVIDRVYPIEKIIEAHQYVDEGHKKGNVVISNWKD